jgi:hypothetical protein
MVREVSRKLRNLPSDRCRELHAEVWQSHALRGSGAASVMRHHPRATALRIWRTVGIHYTLLLEGVVPVRILSVTIALSFLIATEASAQKKKKQLSPCTFNACMSGSTKACSNANPQGRTICCSRACKK